MKNILKRSKKQLQEHKMLEYVYRQIYNARQRV